MRSILRVMLGILVLWSGVEGYSREEFSTEDSGRGKPAGLAGGHSHSGSLSKIKTLGIKPSSRKIDPLKDRLLLEPKEAFRRSFLKQTPAAQDPLLASMSIPSLSVKRAATGTSILNTNELA